MNDVTRLLPRYFNWIALSLLMIGFILPFELLDYKSEINDNRPLEIFTVFTILSLLIFSIVRLKNENSKTLEIRKVAFVSVFIGTLLIVLLNQILLLLFNFQFTSFCKSENLAIFSLIMFQIQFRILIFRNRD